MLPTCDRADCTVEYDHYDHLNDPFRCEDNDHSHAATRPWGPCVSPRLGNVLARDPLDLDLLPTVEEAATDRKEACEAHYPDGYRLVVLGPSGLPPTEVLDRNRAMGGEGK